ncbi:unnamed protein product [Aphanomyces euteiches]|uniref:RNA helicase n=1 Tax=Aphanomyces euteiches TaxID=100861 RepID=A0A6G0WXY0_9STRA|nr:hypothetical protein Ae201684_010624 [Aphanomyces euteiches]
MARSRSASPQRRRRRSRSRSRERRDEFGRERKQTKARQERAELRESTPATDAANEAFQAQRNNLPVGQFKQQILDEIARNQTIVCIGETGSGKTTQIPQFLLEAGYASNGKKIGVTQPRRVATIAVAKRVGEELASNGLAPLAVGSTVRFEDNTTPSTQIKFMTDGILVRECLLDPTLSAYSIIMLDEAHERSINTDILFGLLKAMLKQRPDLKLIITSATLDSDKFSAFFDNCPVFKVPGRSFPVDIYHSKQHQIMGKSGPVSTYIQAAVDTTLQIHMQEPEGHILVFLTGQKEIEEACEMLRKRLDRLAHDEPIKPIDILPLYAALSNDKQRRIFNPSAHARKVIVCTNIAETSLTVDGIKYVVDAGFAKEKVYNPARGMESLVIVPISQVSAQQRAGRAGRTGAGKCYRLYSKQSYASMFNETIPEIQQSNLANTILCLKALGINDVLGFSFLDPPQEDSMLDALLQLYNLGALDDAGNVTATGKAMAQFPLEPRLARVLIEAIRLDCSEELSTIVAMLSVENIFVPHQDKHANSPLLQEYYDPKGDHLMYLRLFQAWEDARDRLAWCEDHGVHMRAFRTAANVQSQIRDLANKVDVARTESAKETPRLDRIRQSVCAGFFQHAAQKTMMQPVYRVVISSGDAKEVQLVNCHPSSVFSELQPPQVCIYHELVYTSKAFMRHVLEVDATWLKLYEPKKAMSLSECYALTDRPVPQAAQSTITTDSSLENANTKSKRAADKTSNDAIAAAKARYMQRKQAQS